MGRVFLSSDRLSTAASETWDLYYNGIKDYGRSAVVKFHFSLMAKFRFLILALATLATTSLVANVFAFNLTLICMVSSPNSTDNSTVSWSKALQTTTLAAFSWGALISAVPFTLLLNRFGARLIFGIFGLISSVGTGLSPLAARSHPWAFIVCRIATGFGFSTAFTIAGAVVARWAPVKEHGLFMGVLMSCQQLGVVLSMPIAGAFCGSRFGWPAVFYFHSLLSLALTLTWFLVYRNFPQEHSCVSAEELSTIGQATEGEGKLPAVPWRQILSSRSTWAVLIAAFGNMCGIQFLNYYVPTYLKVLEFDLQTSGFLAALPVLFMFLVKSISGAISDRLPLSPTASVKLFNSVALFGMAGFLAGLGFVPKSHRGYAFAVLVCGTGILGFHSAGFFKSSSLVGRQFGASVMGLVGLVTCLVMLLIPYVVHALTPSDTLLEWRNTFLIDAAVISISAGVFVCFGSGEPASWTLLPGKEPPEKQNEDSTVVKETVFDAES